MISYSRLADQQEDNVCYIGTKEDESLDTIKLILLEGEHYDKEHDSRYKHDGIIPQIDVDQSERLDGGSGTQDEHQVEQIATNHITESQLRIVLGGSDNRRNQFGP